MATGWAGDTAVQDQIDATIEDAVKRARGHMPSGPGLEHCEACDKPIPDALVTRLVQARLAENAARKAKKYRAANPEEAAMATLVRLTQEQIERLVVEMEEMENRLKDMHAELIEIGVPKDTLGRFAKLHDRYTTGVGFLLKQRELGKSEDSSG